MITSTQNPLIKLARSLLASRKERERQQLFAAEGVRLAEEAIQAGIRPRFALYSQTLSDRGLEIIEFLKSQQVDVEEADADLLDRVSDTRTSQGIFLALPIPQASPTAANHPVLVLDQMRDPGNLGTLMRSAAALGFSTIIQTPGSVDPYSPKVVRSAMGAHFSCRLLWMDAAGIYDFCKKGQHPALTIVVADAHADQACWAMDMRAPICLIVGGEAHGASVELHQIADEKAAIPMTSGSESLNAAVSGSILMYEIYRQRNAK